MMFCEVRFRGRYRGGSGHRLLRRICPLVTQSGHSRRLSPKRDNFSTRVTCTISEGKLHLVGNLVANKGLFDDLCIVNVSERGCVCIARDEHHGTGRNFSTDLSSDFDSVPARHGNIQEDELNMSTSVQQIYTAATTTNFDHHMTEVPKD